MQRIDRARLTAFGGGVVLDVPTRFDDLDVQGHVNNAAAVVLLQEARSHFNRAVGILVLRGGLRVLVAALAVEYAGETSHPGTVRFTTGVLAMGRSSITLGQVARQDCEARLYAETVIVFADAAGPTAIPDELRAAYARYLIPDG